MTTTRWKLAPPWWRRSSAAAGCWARCCPTATEALRQRPERAAFVHAVTAHPFTQKTFGRLGYLPTALLLAYTPASLRFRSIGARPTGERGSVYYACKLLRPAAPQPVYLPEALQPLALPRAHDIGLPLQPQPLPATPLEGSTDLQVQAEPALTPPSSRGATRGPTWRPCCAAPCASCAAHT